MLGAALGVSFGAFVIDSSGALLLAGSIDVGFAVSMIGVSFSVKFLGVGYAVSNGDCV